MKVFTASGEEKDEYCLAPLKKELIKSFSFGGALDVSPSGLVRSSNITKLQNFIDAPHPVLIFSSVRVLTIARILRGAAPFLSVCVEHGMSPFKSYTFSEALLDCDMYIAPTELWAQRLQMLYPSKASKVVYGGYPKLERLRSDRLDFLKNMHSRKVPSSEKMLKKLVVFSWGVDPNVIVELPDCKDVTYLLHPADKDILQKTKFNHAIIKISSPEITASLLAAADFVFGDFSSMTFEAAELGLPTSVFIDKRFYRFDCDLSPDFFDRSSNAFFNIPGVRTFFEKTLFLDKDTLFENLRENNYSKICKNIETVKKENYPNGFFPSQNELSGERIVNIIKSLKNNFLNLKHEINHVNSEGLKNIIFIAKAYQEILGREVDWPGLEHYISKFYSDDKPSSAVAVSILFELATSKEGEATLLVMGNRLPTFRF